ncbi:MAG TPA: diguanylate cyclase [Arenimonas sp.]|nr:diguanylate cyclase [Arenimonas sp.]HPW31352.1 diguanylate cyclase [Arenimonas sp.]
MTAASSSDQTNRLKNLPQRTYGLRVLGMGLAGLSVSSVMWELQSSTLHWVWMVFTCLLWPHLAYFLARRSRDPLRRELQNFVFDSFIAGSWVPLMHFNALPSAVLLAVVMSDKINTGVRGLWLRSLPGMFLALLGGGLLTGFAFQPNTSMTVLLATMPILIIHTIAVSISSYQLVRKVQRQNLKLEELSRIDTLTGLGSRGHWQTLAENILQQHRATGSHVTVMLLDVDQFKDINDCHGHAVGDDVLRGIAELMQGYLPANSHAGRLGGDEFAVVLPVQLHEAEAIAEKIRMAVENSSFSYAPDLQCSISIGIAQPDNEAGLREWLEVADRALYRAKHAGRNRTASRDASPEEEAAIP